MGFADSFELRQDIKPKKTDLTTLQCYVCGELNASNSQMTKHIKSQHYPKVKASMFGAPRDHQCSECKLMFQSEDSLGLHTCGQVRQISTSVPPHVLSLSFLEPRP